MKIADIDREIRHIFWITWGISIKFSGNMRLMIVLKVTKNQGFTLNLEDTFFGEPQGGGQIDHPLSILALNKAKSNFFHAVLSWYVIFSDIIQ